MHCAQWTCLDKAGHEACKLTHVQGGWVLTGMAVFDHQVGPACLQHRLSCNANWESTEAVVTGWVGARDLQLHIVCQAGRWFINGQVDHGLSGLRDIDLGFTPASNTNAVRRLNLQPGESAESVAVWLDPEDWCVKPLHQSYQRLDQHRYAYASPRHGYQAILTLDEFGWVRDYPGLWRMVNPAD